MKLHILQLARASRYSPISAITNLAFYAAARGEVTAEDADALFDEWRADTVYPSEKRALIIARLKRDIEEGSKYAPNKVLPEED